MIQSRNLLSHTYNGKTGRTDLQKMSFIFVSDKKFISADIGLLNHKTDCVLTLKAIIIPPLILIWSSWTTL